MSTIESYYPALSSLINIGSLPPQLDFIQDIFGDLLDRLFFTDLQYSRSSTGGREFYSLTILTYRKIAFTLPGTDLILSLNTPLPLGQEPPSKLTRIPITVGYEWGIIDVFRGFDLQEFLLDPKAIFSLIARSMSHAVQEVVQSAIDNLTAGSLYTFVQQVNTRLNLPPGSPNIEIPDDPAMSAVQKVAYITHRIEELAHLPALEAIYKVFFDGENDLEGELQKIDQLFRPLFDGESISEYVQNLLIPKIDASLYLTAAVEFPRSILKPIRFEQGVSVGVEPDESVKSILKFADAVLNFSTAKGIGFDAWVSGTLTPSQIGDTGLVISFTEVKLDLSTTTNISEAAADGRGPDFVGVYIGEAEIQLPKFWKTKPENERPSDPNDRARIVATNVLIGTGGLSGTFSFTSTTAEPFLETYFGTREATLTEPAHPGFGIKLDRFDIQFQQGAIIHSDIQGTLAIPPLGGNGDPVDIRVQITIDEHGFRVGATLDANAASLSIGIDPVFNFTFHGVAIGSQDGRWFLEIGGVLDITAEVPVVGRFIREPVNIEKLVIWSNGEFDFQGGSFVLPKITPLKLGPVELSVTAIHFGRDQQGGRKYKFIGFDGGLKTGTGGVDARGEGIKFYFTVDGGTFESFLRIETIRIDLRIPGDAPPETAALLLKGYVSMKNPPDNNAGNTGEHSRLTEYAGGITFSMPRMKFGGGA
ncbi:MAG: hypothetical protein ABIR47_00400, partial [Candidatus Kapaibacterium sp.]